MLEDPAVILNIGRCFPREAAAGPDPEGISREEWVAHGETRGKQIDTRALSSSSMLLCLQATSGKAERSSKTPGLGNRVLGTVRSSSYRPLPMALHSHACPAHVPWAAHLGATLVQVNGDHRKDSHGSLPPLLWKRQTSPQAAKAKSPSPECLISNRNNQNSTINKIIKKSAVSTGK